MQLRNKATTNQEFERQVAGERFVARLRLIFSVVSIVLVLLYFFHSDPEYWSSAYATIILLSFWGAFSAAYIVQFSKGYFRPWMPYLSVTVDFVMVTAAQVAYMATLPLNFINGPLTECYFVVIGLAALRKSRRLLFYSGIGSAVVHLLLSTIAFLFFLPDGYALVEIGGHPIEITFLDEVVRAVLMVIVAIALGYMTKQLVDSERQYYELFENVPEGILIISQSGMILNLNHRLAEMAGASLEMLQGKSITTLLSLSTKTPFNLSHINEAPFETAGILTRSDQETIPVYMVAARMIYRDEPCVEMSIRDVTEQQHLEHQLAQSQKMETLGRLASGLAHDFNNLLGGILGSASLLDRRISRSERLDDKEKLFHHLAVIRECSEQARDTISRLLSFSRTRALDILPVNLNQVVTDVSVIARNTLGDRIVITTEVPEEIAVTLGNETALSQALLNLCINAKDAMPEGGEVTIRLKEHMADDQLKKIVKGAASPDYWCVEVQDTGTGIEPHVLHKMFEPFFTTKPAGEGTGLGLPMVHNIVRDHRGYVDVSTTAGAGSCFRLFLPKNAEEPERAKVAAPQVMPEGQGTVLVVDDNHHLRAAVREMLSDLGYDVITASDGKEALHLIEKGNKEIDLCILDIIMPRMDGDKILRVLHDKKIETKVIVASGYLDKAQGQTIRELGVDGQLAKPYTMPELAQMVADVLKKSP